MNTVRARLSAYTPHLIRRSIEGWRELLFPASGPAWLQRLLLCAGLLILATHPPWLIGWPKTPSMWHSLAWDSSLFSQSIGTDFFAIYEAGYFFRNGHDAYLVDGKSLTELSGPLRAPYAATFRYLPINLAWLAAPLSLIPPWDALRLWTGFLGLLALIGMGATVRLATLYQFGWRGRIGAICLWSFSMPLMIELAMGQFSFFVGMLLLFSIYHIAEPKDQYLDEQSHPRILPWALGLWLKNFAVMWYPWFVGNFLRHYNHKEKKEDARRLLFLATLAGALLAVTTLGYFVWAPSKPLPREGYDQYIEGNSLQWPVRRFTANATSGRLFEADKNDFYWGRQGVGLFLAISTSLPDLLALPFPITELDSEFFPVSQSWLDRYHSKLIKYFNIFLTVLIIAAIFYAGVRGTGALEALALGWLWWFFVYLDCWEHHYTMLTPLLALLVFSRRLPLLLGSIVAILWALPSPWWPINHYAATIWETSPLLHGVLVWGYFAQRPLGVILVTLWLFKRLASLWFFNPPQPATPSDH